MKAIALLILSIITGNTFDPFQPTPPTAGDIHELPVLLSWYDSNLCDESPINCDGNPAFFGSGLRTSEHLYGKVAACPLDWTKHIDNGTTTTITVNGMTLYCVDNGGAVEVAYKRVYVPASMRQDKVYDWMWVVIIDVYHDSRLGPPSWQLMTVTEWDLGIGSYEDLR